VGEALARKPPVRSSQSTWEAARIVSPVADYLMLKSQLPEHRRRSRFFSPIPVICVRFSRPPGELQPESSCFLKVSPLGGIATIERVLEANRGPRLRLRIHVQSAIGQARRLADAGFHLARDAGCGIGTARGALADSCIRETYRRMDRQRYVIIGAGGNQHRRGCLCQNQARRFTRATAHGAHL